MASDPCTLSATDIARLVRANSLSPVRVIRAYLDRIAALDPSLNAFAVVRAHAALAEAKILTSSSDRAYMPLAGVPVAVQDDIAVAGEPTRAGSAATSTTPALADDPLVARLREAGAIIIGKTRLSELSVWPFTVSAAFGITRNPWNRTHTPGGSANGVALAAGMAALALGSDNSGSLRVPAACCSLVGLKPSSDLLPRRTQSKSDLTQLGPMGRTVSDVALALDVLADLRQSIPATPPTAGLRIGVSFLPPVPGTTLDLGVRAALERTVSTLALAGHTIIREDPPYPSTLGLNFLRRYLPALTQSAAGLDATQLEPRTKNLVRIGRLLTRLNLQTTDDETLTRVFLHWFHGRDLLLTPVITTPPPPITQWQQDGWLRTTLGVGRWLYTIPWNLTDFPSASVPIGLNDDLLPLGVQIIAPRGGERLILALARQIEVLQPFPALPVR